MQPVSAAAGVPEPTENLGISEGHKRRPLKAEVLEKFAQTMGENIIQSFLRRMETVEAKASSSYHNQEMLAEALASTVVDVALQEVSKGHNVKDFQSSRSAEVKIGGRQAFLDESDRERDVLNMDAEMDAVKGHHSYDPPLSQTGLPTVGSLDYPDAPPTTPLLPELERSRHSFARKLKGGLAKVFLPSPPPPTPKDTEDDSDSAIDDPRVELMEHLMQSLSTDEIAEEVGPPHGAEMDAFAEALSCTIIDSVLKSRERIADDSDLHLLAQQLAETILTSSLDEAKLLI